MITIPVSAKIADAARNAALYALAALQLGGLSACTHTSAEKAGKRKTGMIADQKKSDWAIIGYGGGGAMFHPEVSPFNPDYAFVSCDMTGSYVTYNGGRSWAMFNLHSPVDFYVFDPLDSNTVYAKSVGLFKSTDKGATWNLLYPSPLETRGIVCRGDHAEEVLVTRDSTVREVEALAVDPENSKRLFAVIAIDKAIALYASEDGGTQWTREKELEEKATHLFIDPSSAKNDRTLYITGNNGVVVRNNRQWMVHKNPAGVKMMTHYTGGFDKKSNRFIIYGISGKSYFNPEGDASGIYFSDDGGSTWQNRQLGLTAFAVNNEAPEWRTIATSLFNPGVVYVSYHGLKVNKDTTFIGVAKSLDFGKTWALTWKDVIAKSGNTPSENLKDGWINDRFGPTWGENPFSIGVSPANPNVCYATDFGRTIKTADGGTTWEQVYSRKKDGGGWISRGLEVTTGYRILWDPFDKNNVFICNTDIGLMESKDGGVSWESITKDNGIPQNWQNSTYWLAFDPEVKNKAWAAMSGTHDLPRPKMFRKNGVRGYEGGIVMTEDGGKSWKPVSASIGEAAVTHVLIDPSGSKNARTLYACAFGKGVYKSVDGGKTWALKNKGISGKEPFSWRITRRDRDGALFLVNCRRSEDGSIGTGGDGALYRSDDGAESWQAITLPAQTNGPMCVIADEENKSRLILSAWGRTINSKLSRDTGGGIYLSENDGHTWRPVLQKDQHIHDVTYDARTKTYYACGFEGSAYKSQNNGETWLRINGFNFKWGKRVDMDPSDPAKIFVITFGGGVWHGSAKAGDEAVKGISTEQLVSPEY